MDKKDKNVSLIWPLSIEDQKFDDQFYFLASNFLS